MSARRTLPLIAALLAATLAPPASGAAERPARGTAPAAATSPALPRLSAAGPRRTGETAASAQSAAPIPRAAANPRQNADAIPRSRGQTSRPNQPREAASEVRAASRPRGTDLSSGTPAAHRSRNDPSSGTPASHRSRNDLSSGTPAAHRPRNDLSSGTPAAHRSRTDTSSGTPVAHRSRTDTSSGTPVAHRSRTDLPGTPVARRPATAATPATSRPPTDMSSGTFTANARTDPSRSPRSRADQPVTASRPRTDLSPGTATGSVRTGAHGQPARTDLSPGSAAPRPDASRPRTDLSPGTATDSAREVLAVPAVGDLSRKPSTVRRARNAAEDALRRSGLDIDLDDAPRAGEIDPDVEPAPTDMPQQPAARARKVEPAPTDMPQTSAARARERRPSANLSPETDVRAARGPLPTTQAACAAALEAAPAQQYERTRAVMREFWWSDMARFFETALDEAEPLPTEVSGPDTLPADEAIRRSGLARKPLEALARARAVDLLSERDLAKLDKTLHGATPAALRALLRADSPSLRAHVWTWLATTPSGVCALFRLDRAEVEAAIHDRSIAVEHGEDLIFRPLGDYALAARSRLAAPDPQNFDALLRALWDDAGLDPRLRAMVAGLRVRRGHADSIEPALRDPVASVRAAVAAAALDRDRERYELRVLDHAAADPADLVTELIVGELLGGPDGAPRGALATSRDPRIVTALARWKGRGDPMAPLPAPEHPLRFAKPKRTATTPASEPTESEPTDPPRREPERPAQRPAQPRHDHRPAEPDDAPSLPGIFDDPSGR